jgi:hypothetical protein
MGKFSSTLYTSISKELEKGIRPFPHPCGGIGKILKQFFDFYIYRERTERSPHGGSSFVISEKAHIEGFVADFEQIQRGQKDSHIRVLVWHFKCSTHQKL